MLLSRRMEQKVEPKKSITIICVLNVKGKVINNDIAFKTLMMPSKKFYPKFHLPHKPSIFIKVSLKRYSRKKTLFTKMKFRKLKMSKKRYRVRKLYHRICCLKVRCPEDFNQMKQRLEKDFALLNGKLIEMKEHLTPYKNNINNTIPILENIVSYYRKADGKTKKKILGCIFSEKLVLE